MNIFPYFEKKNSIINEGEVFTLHDFCKKKFSSKCIKFYTNILDSGLKECPYGFFIYCTKYSLYEGKIYTSLIVNDVLNKKIKNKGFIKNIFKEEELVRLIGICEINEKKYKEENDSKQFETEIIRSVFHEIRRLNLDIDSAGINLKKTFANDININLIDNILQSIKLISIRLDSYELLKNPSTITSAKQTNMIVYKKFDKSRFILNSKAKQKHITLNFTNESYFKIDGYDIFDLLPYIILDNAIKYSPNNQTIDVIFNESSKNILIKNIGPKIEIEEKEKLCQLGFRGKNSSAFQGSGLGLNLFKQICDLHKIKFRININNEIITVVDAIPYSNFYMELFF